MQIRTQVLLAAALVAVAASYVAASGDSSSGLLSGINEISKPEKKVAKSLGVDGQVLENMITLGLDAKTSYDTTLAAVRLELGSDLLDDVIRQATQKVGIKDESSGVEPKPLKLDGASGGVGIGGGGSSSGRVSSANRMYNPSSEDVTVPGIGVIDSETMKNVPGWIESCTAITHRGAKDWLRQGRSAHYTEAIAIAQSTFDQDGGEQLRRVLGELRAEAIDTCRKYYQYMLKTKQHLYQVDPSLKEASSDRIDSSFVSGAIGMAGGSSVIRAQNEPPKETSPKQKKKPKKGGSLRASGEHTVTKTKKTKKNSSTGKDGTGENGSNK